MWDANQIYTKSMFNSNLNIQQTQNKTKDTIE